MLHNNSINWERTIMDIQNEQTSDLRDMTSQEYVRSLSPNDFEKYCMNILQGYAKETGLQNFTIDHNCKIQGYDGSYQIDVFATFYAMGMSFKVLCECKQYKNSVKREVVSALYQKLLSLGLQKGVLMATANFQSGAIKFAHEHGIALIKVYDYSYEYFSHSSGNDIEDPNDPFIVAEKMMPPVRAVCYEANGDYPRIIYPTREMIEDILAKQKKMLKQMGFLFE